MLWEPQKFQVRIGLMGSMGHDVCVDEPLFIYNCNLHSSIPALAAKGI